MFPISDEATVPDGLDSGRDATTGRFTKGNAKGQQFDAGNRPANAFEQGNDAAMVHGAYSTQLQQQAEPWLREFIDAIKADLGEDVSTLKANMIEQAATTLVILNHLAQNIAGSGVLTAKGKRRAAVSVYLQTLDRYLRVVQRPADREHEARLRNRRAESRRA